MSDEHDMLQFTLHKVHPATLYVPNSWPVAVHIQTPVMKFVFSTPHYASHWHTKKFNIPGMAMKLLFMFVACRFVDKEDFF